MQLERASIFFFFFVFQIFKLMVPYHTYGTNCVCLWYPINLAYIPYIRSTYSYLSFLHKFFTSQRERFARRPLIKWGHRTKQEFKRSICTQQVEYVPTYRTYVIKSMHNMVHPFGCCSQQERREKLSPHSHSNIE